MICAHAPGNHRGGGHWAPTPVGLGQYLQHPNFQCHLQEMHRCCFLYLTSAALRLWLRTSRPGGVLGNNHWNVHPQSSSCSWPCSALNCLKSTCYNIRCSLSADHYTRKKSVSCPKTELTGSKLILKNINPNTDLRHLSWELAFWELLKTCNTNPFPTSSNTPEAWVFMAT